MKPIDMFLNNTVWAPIEPAPVPSDELHVTHSGVFTIGEVQIKCWQLSDGRRMLDADSVQAFFGFDSSDALADEVARFGKAELAERLRKPLEVPFC